MLKIANIKSTELPVHQHSLFAVSLSADQRLCFRYMNSTIPLFPKPKIQASSHLLWLYSPVWVGPGPEPPKQVFSQCSTIMIDKTPASVSAVFKELAQHPPHTLFDRWNLFLIILNVF